MALNIKKIIKMYEDGKSPYEIAEELDTYPNKIRRLLKIHTTMRSKGEAQSIALKNGRKKHPPEGKLRSDEERQKIAEGINEFWKNLSDDKDEQIIEMAKENWGKRSKQDLKKMTDAANSAIRKAAKEGSKAEKFISEIIEKEGYSVSRHRRDVIKNDNLELDLYVPDLSLVIEIDGPSHFLPIWGEDSLKKTISADTEKSGLVLQNGLVLLRIKYMAKNFTVQVKHKIQNKVLEVLKQLETKFPDKHNR